MDAKVMSRIQELVYEASGIRLKDSKMSMVASRLARRLRALNLADEMTYLNYLEDQLDSELVNLIDVISTNVTSFFREAHHFSLIEQAIEGQLAAGQNRFRFWSAACSSGEEPYSLAMTIADVMTAHAGKNVDWRILATDISTQVLGRARSAKYALDQLDSIDAARQRRHVRVTSDGFEIASALRQRIVFHRLNLSQPPFPMRGPLDAVMCRNVMIYFDGPVKDGIFNECGRLLRPGGLLMLGHAESLPREFEVHYERVGHAAYRKRG